ncbi:hypothetical protein QWY82_08485 [Simiduia curdlanivorans]|uniref:Uncharacterized protein n=1 Tax=Simiduia curdlanivorans TaxID=1492769 RepID=A0ABV8V720_9GAMM|nr:hypothetical protein [Simiduia curdlanivorans]MDN3638840.1 hypothetical protein [Simiduia curdlanivorans]
MKILIACCLAVLMACSSIDAAEQPAGDRQDFYLLLSGLLNVNQDEYVYTDNTGKVNVDELMMFKALEKIYVANIEPDLDNNRFSVERLKVVMFFAFYAEQRNASAFQEYLAADLMPIYLANKKTFVSILQELPFLAAANCARLSAYFGHEGLHLDQKPSFVKDNQAFLQQQLGGSQYDQCMRFF